MAKKVIITSGAMRTKIDAVRSIENSSTGSLGSLFADEFAKLNYEVVYIYTRGSKLPLNSAIKLVEIKTSEQIVAVLKDELNTVEAPIVIHAMAIADFKIPTVISLDKLYDIYQEPGLRKAEFKEKLLRIDKPDKLSSSTDQLAYFMRDIKVIDQIKKINESAVLVGFKLLSNVNEVELLDVACKLKERTNSEIVVANIKEFINKDQHEAYIIADDVVKVNTKKDIVATVIAKLGEK